MEEDRTGAKYMNSADNAHRIPDHPTSVVKTFCQSFFLATILIFKKIPAEIVNRFQRYRHDRRRIPKRKTKSRVYILVGYTTKAKVDKRYRSIKIQRLFRGFLVLGIIVISIVLIFQALSPMINFDSYKQMFGIEEFDDLTANDPFGDISLSMGKTATASSEEWEESRE